MHDYSDDRIRKSNPEGYDKTIELLEGIAKGLNEFLFSSTGRQIGFTVFLFDIDQPDKDMNFVSNVNIEEVKTKLANWLANSLKGETKQ